MLYLKSPNTLIKIGLEMEAVFDAVPLLRWWNSTRCDAQGSNLTFEVNS